MKILTQRSKDNRVIKPGPGSYQHTDNYATYI